VAHALGRNDRCANGAREHALGLSRCDNVHLIPGLGAHRLDRLEPEHLEKLYRRMVERGSAPATAHQAHRTIRAALNEAVRRGNLTRNPALLAKTPHVIEKEIQPFSIDEVKSLLAEASKRRNSARWAIAFALGLRQGEVLGLRWSDVSLDDGSLRARRGRMRPTYAHGCVTPCNKKAGYCPNRRQTRADAEDTKSRAGRRTVGLPEALVKLLASHKAVQDCDARSLSAVVGRRLGLCLRDRTFAQPPTLTITSGNACFATPVSETVACTTLGTPRRPCC
jgi:integrase